MERDSRILVTGASGLVGSSIVRRLKELGYTNVLTPSHSEVDFSVQFQTDVYFWKSIPEYVFNCAAKVGGIQANINSPALFLYNNLAISSNVINASRDIKVKRLINMGSSCIYPTNCEQPMNEEQLLTGPFESTNEPYAIAKIAALKLCETFNRQYGTDYYTVIPPNLHGINDKYSPIDSHFIPSLVIKLHKAKIENDPEVVLWGTGTPVREIMFTDELAKRCVYLMENYSNLRVGSYINVGSNKACSIMEWAERLAKIIGYRGKIAWDDSKPDGMKMKIMSSEKFNKLTDNIFNICNDGLIETYEDYKRRFNGK